MRTPAAVRPKDHVLVDRIRDAGYAVHSIHRHYPPLDHGPAEVLFVGYRARTKGAVGAPLTAWIPATTEGTVIVTDGW